MRIEDAKTFNGKTNRGFRKMQIDGEYLEQIQDEARSCLEEGWDLEELAEEIYNSELNYNNADITSGQRCWTYDEVCEAVYSVKEENNE